MNAPSTPPRAMTRCECSGLAFSRVAELVGGEGWTSLEVLCRRAGCGLLCTACRPDLEAYLRRHAAARGAAAVPAGMRADPAVGSHPGHDLRHG